MLQQSRPAKLARCVDYRQTVAEFLQFYSLDADTKFPESTLVLNIDCEGDLAIEHLLINKGKLWLVWYGVLLEAYVAEGHKLGFVARGGCRLLANEK